MAELGNKEAARSIDAEIGVAKAEPGNKEKDGSFSGEIGVTKDEATVNKALLDKYLLKTGICSVPEIMACLYKYAEESVKPMAQKSETVVFPVTMTKERVPDAYIEKIKKHPSRKMSPLKDSIARGKPEYKEYFLAANAQIDYRVDVEQDCLRQYEENGYAEIGVDYTDGVKKVYILPAPAPAPSDDEDAATE